ncbi:MAG: outer membrane lipoprotein-sorting protein [Alphaproteobacteria bacterium]|nr:MAG: outer membrane lipoprotein-sorting protein [Alphaproteobacteria bacterium]
MTEHTILFPQTKAQQFFWRMMGLRWPIIILSIIFLGFTGSFLPTMVKDTTSDAFINPEEPSLIYRHKVQEIFGLSDPIVVAVINESDTGIYNPDSLTLVQWLTDNIQRLDNIDPDRLISLATESNIVGTNDGMEVQDFFDMPPKSDSRIGWIKNAIDHFPLYQGSLVARDRSTTIIIAELIDEAKAPETYEAILKLIKSAPNTLEDEIHVAGEGAVSGYMATYIDNDTKTLNPLAGLIITIILFLAFFTPRATILPNLIVLATAVGTFGIMAGVGVSFYVITNGLIVCLIGIAVADSLHIFSQYYEEMTEHPDAGQKELVVRAMASMWRPVTLTTVTTMAGFLSLWPTNDMPPIQYFGLFGALGVFIAWAYSLTFLPALLSLLPKRGSRSFKHQQTFSKSAHMMQSLGQAVLANPKKILTAGAMVVLLGIIGTNRVIIEEMRIENFKSTEPLYKADKRINAKMDGTYYLDIMIETPELEDLYKAENLNRIDALQEYLETLPNIGGTTSIVDYIKQMHKAVNENNPDYYSIPDNDMLIAQLFLLYSASGEPTDFEEEIDGDRRLALVRANLNVGSFVQNRAVVLAVEAYLTDHFNTDQIKANVTGRVNVDYHWIKGIKDSHMASVLVAFLAVISMTALLFRSLWAGLFAAIPVGMSILLIYAVMGFGDIWLGVGTSMFASIAIGLGVDFAIHTIDRMKELLSEGTSSVESRLINLYPTTGRALFFNFAAIALGFSVLLTSDVPPLIKFGGLVAIAISTSFLASMTILPALVTLHCPDFLLGKNKQQKLKPVTVSVLTGVMLMGMVAFNSEKAQATDLLNGENIIKNVIARDEGEFVTRNLTLALTDRRGKLRTQETKSFRRYFGPENMREKRTVIFYTAPTNIRGTAFLTYDYPDVNIDDDQWLYMPALRKVRRISASDRGDYFLGTDLTYEEIKKESKVEFSDYHYRTLGTEDIDGFATLTVEGTPVDDKISKELGYSKVIWSVDPEIWLARKVEFWDRNGNHLKTITNQNIEKIDNIWTVQKIHVINHKTGHKSLLTFSNIDYKTAVKANMFEQHMLRRGIR